MALYRYLFRLSSSGGIFFTLTYFARAFHVLPLLPEFTIRNSLFTTLEQEPRTKTTRQFEQEHAEVTEKTEIYDHSTALMAGGNNDRFDHNDTTGTTHEDNDARFTAKTERALRLQSHYEAVRGEQKIGKDAKIGADGGTVGRNIGTGWPWVDGHPGLPQTRTCGITAYGSSVMTSLRDTPSGWHAATVTRSEPAVVRTTTTGAALGAFAAAICTRARSPHTGSGPALCCCP